MDTFKRSSAVKVVLMILTLAILPEIVLAQRPIMIGVRGGVNLGRQTYDSLGTGESIGTHPGLIIGAQVDVPILDTSSSGSVSAMIQLLLNQRGTKNDINSGPTFSYTSTYTQTYIDLPILAKYTFAMGQISPYVFVGPSFGMYISNSYSSTTTVGGASTSQSGSSPDSSVKKLNIAAVIGAGLAYKLDAGPSIVLDASYGLGLTQMFVGATGSSGKFNDVRIMAGVMFPIGSSGRRQ